jgi:anti-sigma B factor antagonist
MDYLSIERDGDRSLVLRGELDMASEPEVRTLVEQIIVTDGILVLDMAGVTFLDSTGARVLIDAALSLRGRGSVVIRSPSHSVVRVFELFGLLPETAALPLHFDLDGAAPESGPGAVHRLEALINATVENNMTSRELIRSARRLIAEGRARRSLVPPASG